MLAGVAGIEVVGQARDALEARKLAEKTRPDVAILDLRMPYGSGADVLQELKRLMPRTRVIMLTNYPHADNRKKCLEGGADCFLDKSNEFERVLSVLKEWLPRPAQG